MRQTLYYREGSSDKMYQAAIEPKRDKFVVNFAFGRRGTTLQTGTKTQAPVDHEQAVKIFNKLLDEKKAKGYTPGEDGTPYQHSDKQVSGIHCQLLNSIEEVEVERLVNDTLHCAQEKFDGKRILIRKTGDDVSAINRKGLIVGILANLAQEARQISGDFILDGECVGEVLNAFDLLALNGDDLRAKPYESRYGTLAKLLTASRSAHIQLVPSYVKPEQKARLLENLLAKNKEGIVFKRLDAPYVAGRPESGGKQLKHKFYATLSAVVSQINAQRSVGLKLLKGKEWVSAGNVTVPVNVEVPKSGAVVEIRYLYAFKESGSLYQPAYLGARTDVAESECKTDQLKFKSTDEEES